jgi:glycosyltransferase involved in cell wall biosynthesis
MGYLCKYLPKLGWNPIIVSEYIPQNIFPNLAQETVTTHINFYYSKNKIWQKIKYTFVFFTELFFNYKSLITKKKAKQKIKQNDISLILSSSSCRPYSALAASRLSKKYNIPFVMDLRDIIEQFPSNEHISKNLKNVWLNNLFVKIITEKFLRQRNKILQKADVVTTVSTYHEEILSKYNDNVQLIFNGFDSELFYPQKIKNKKFVISYAGRIESQEIKDPSLFFEAIANLLNKKEIDIEKLKIQFYLTDEKSKKIIRSLAEKSKITDFIDIFDTVLSTEIPRILNESSVLLLLANKSTGENTPKGIMGTKLFEYLAVEKPILCVRNDEGCLEETINYANAGLSASTEEETEKFILEKYAEWKKNGFTHQTVNKEYIQQFSRKYQAEQFAELFTAILP